MIITARKLRQLKACTGAVEWVEITFPNGAELTPETLARCKNDAWVCWLACRLSKVYRYWCAGVASREAARGKLSLREFSMNVTPENYRRAIAAAYAGNVTNAAFHAASAAANAANDTNIVAAANAAHVAYLVAYSVGNDAAYVAASATNDAVYKELRQEAERVLLLLEEL